MDKAQTPTPNGSIHFDTITDALRVDMFPLPLILGDLDPCLDYEPEIREIGPAAWTGLPWVPIPVMTGTMDDLDEDGEPVRVPMYYVNIKAYTGLVSQTSKKMAVRVDEDHLTLRGIMLLCQHAVKIRQNVSEMIDKRVPSRRLGTSIEARNVAIMEAMAALYTLETHGAKPI